MNDYIWIIIICSIIAIAVLLVVLISKGKSSVMASNAQASVSTTVTGGFDPSLQYNLVNHPVRQQMQAALAAGAAPPSPPNPQDIDAMRKKLNDWYNSATSNGTVKPMDKWGKAAIEGALDAASMGNFAIGVVICYAPQGVESDPNTWVELIRAGNRLFTRNPKDLLATTGYVPRLASDCHGEMVALDVFEDRLTSGMYDKTSPNYMYDHNSPIDFRRKNDIVGYNTPNGIILITQLESCQMCIARVGNSGIAADLYIASDNGGALQHSICSCAPAYGAMISRQKHDVADVSNEMIQFAQDAFAGPNAAWITYAAWKLAQVGSPVNLTANYHYCDGMWWANDKLGKTSLYDWGGWYRTLDLSKGPFLSCTVKPELT